jgi:hypothetical protein
MRESILNMNDENLFLDLGVHIILSVTSNEHLPVQQGYSTHVQLATSTNVETQVYIIFRSY